MSSVASARRGRGGAAIVAALAVVVVVALGPRGHADPVTPPAAGGARAPAPAPAAAPLARAQAHLLDGEYEAAARLAGGVARDGAAPPSDRSEAWRIDGLALFHLGRRDEAEAALFEFLKLEPDAHLDPSLVPPEAIVFFEEVRARHAGAIRTQKPRRRSRFSAALSLVPVYGQVQNGQRAKGWVLGGAEVALLGANVATYALLTNACSPTDRTCTYDPGTARTLRTVNLVSGAALIGVVAYGMVDGWLGYRRLVNREASALAFAPGPGGASVVWSCPF